MKIYEGTLHTNPFGGRVVLIRDTDHPDKKPRVLRTYKDVMNHSPNGFMWGDGGSGPAQLALAILLDHFGDAAHSLGCAQAIALYQRFKFRVVANFERESGWTLTSDQINEVIALINETASDKGIVIERRKAQQEAVRVERETGIGIGGGKIVWDTDDRGIRIRERGADDDEP